MASFAKLREPEKGNAYVECVHNRDIEHEASGDFLFFVMSDEVNKKFGIDYDNDGEMLIYHPDFGHPDMGDDRCLWVAQTIDFDFFTLEDLIWKD
jgi:hypothetical protein